MHSLFVFEIQQAFCRFTNAIPLLLNEAEDTEGFHQKEYLFLLLCMVQQLRVATREPRAPTVFRPEHLHLVDTTKGLAQLHPQVLLMITRFLISLLLEINLLLFGCLLLLVRTNF